MVTALTLTGPSFGGGSILYEMGTINLLRSFWFTVKPLEPADEGTDRWAVEQNWISLTPLRIDLTDEAHLESVAQRRPLDRALAAATSTATSSAEAAKAVRAEEAAAPVEQ